MQYRLRRIALRAILSLAALGVLALGVAVWLEARRTQYLTRHYGPPGELVDIGSHRLHLYCEGAGSPPVLLDAGSGLAYTNWSAVQPALGRVTRVCSFDRSGLGWSELGPRDPSANQATEELALLLEASGISGPWVVVGHSLGGLYAQQLLNLHPELVAALVLVDPATEDQFETIPGLRDLVTAGPLEALTPLLTLAGLHRLSLPDVPETDSSWVARQLHATSRHLRRASAEWWAMEASAAQVRAARTDWGDTPLVVLQAGVRNWPEDWSEDHVSEADSAGAAGLQRLAQRSSRGRVLLIEQSGHGIPWEDPEAVISAVDSTVAEIGTPAPPAWRPSP